MSEKSEKLQKVLARAGHGSRREIETIISAGRVSVDGKIATLGDRVEVTQSIKIRIDGHLISVKESVEQVCRVLAYYKPEGELCTRSDPEGRPTVFDRLPKLRGARWVAVGRLDVNTCGLLLFTTDGELANRLMHPSREVEREYAVRVFGEIDDDKIKQLSRGVQLEDGPAAFKTIKFTGGEGINQWYNVTLTEGRNREVRRLWEAVGVQVSRLIRVRYGDIQLPKGLPRGGYTELPLGPTNYLRALVELDVETNSKVAVEKDRRPMKANQIRRAVKRHSQVNGERTGEGVSARPTGGRTGENAGGRPSSRTGENAGGRSGGRTGENAGGRSSGRPGENAGGRSSGRPGENAGGRSSSRTGEKAGGRSSRRTGEGANGRSDKNSGGRSR
jgi:23S rRNA pseudouridine2605 synthase